ncbi:MAG: hypothetical protein RR621_03440 [Lachnospiraceae bacterium]
MKKTTNTLIVTGIVIIGLLVGGFIFIKEELGSRMTQHESKQELQKKQKEEMKFREEEETKATKYYIGDMVETMGFSYTVEKVEITKDSHGYRQPEGQMPLVEHSKTTLDAEGNITNEYSYVFVNLKIKKMDNTEDAFSVGNIRFAVEGKGDEIEHCGEFQYFGTDNPGTFGKEYGFITLSEGEEQNLILVYVQRDDEVTGQNIYLHINPQGGYQEGVKNEQERWILLRNKGEGED